MRAHNARYWLIHSLLQCAQFICNAVLFGAVYADISLLCWCVCVCVPSCVYVGAVVMKYIWEKMVIGVLRIFDPFSSSVRWVINNTHRRLHLTCIVLSQWRRVRFYSLLLTQLRTSSGAAISTHFKFQQFAMWEYAKINSINWAIHIVLKIILLPKIWITEAWH